MEPQAPIEESKIPELPEAGFRKNMGDAQELVEKYKNKEELTVDEERLVDLVTYHDTGKRLEKFKPKPHEAYPFPVFSKDTSFTETTKPKTKPAKRKDIPVSSTPIIASGSPLVNAQGIS